MLSGIYVRTLPAAVAVTADVATESCAHAGITTEATLRRPPCRLPQVLVQAQCNAQAGERAAFVDRSYGTRSSRMLQKTGLRRSNHSRFAGPPGCCVAVLPMDARLGKLDTTCIHSRALEAAKGQYALVTCRRDKTCMACRPSINSQPCTQSRSDSGPQLDPLSAQRQFIPRRCVRHKDAA